MSIDESRAAAMLAEGQDTEQEGLDGSFLKRTLGEGYFKLNSAGTKFVKTTSSSTITPFRFYLKEPAEASGINAYNVFLIDADEDVTSIEDIINKPDTKVEQTYDINGRRIITISRPGIYIKGGKKYYTK